MLANIVQTMLFETARLFRGFTLPHNEIVEVARRYKDDCLRDGTRQLFGDLNALKVPILVFSAGLGDSVCAVLEETNIKLANVKVGLIDKLRLRF